MTEKELEIEEFDTDDLPEDDDIDFDDVEETSEEEPETTEEEPKEPIIDEREQELSRLRQEREKFQEEKKRLAAEKEEAELKAFNIEQKAIEGAITQWQMDLKREKGALRDLQIQLKEAELNQDLDAVKKISYAIAEKSDAIEGFSNEITKYAPLLNRQPPQRKEVAAPSNDKTSVARELGQKWIEENSWWNDPKYSKKREKADAVYNDLIAKKYDPSTMQFWLHISKEIDAFDNPDKQRAKLAVRPATATNGAKNMTVKKKGDADILSMTKKILDTMGHGMPETSDKGAMKKWEQRRKDVYLSVKKQAEKARSKQNG